MIRGLLNDGDARHQLATESVAVPHLVDSEVADALRSQVCCETITDHEAGAARAIWGRPGVRRFDVSGLLGRIWDLRANLTGYDAPMRGWASHPGPNA